MHLSVIYHSAAGEPLRAAWRFLWCKSAEAFDPRQHCAKCLKGRYETRFGLDMPADDMVDLDHGPGALLYFCGVSKPYRWDRNLHLAVRVTGDPQDIASATAWNGDKVTIAGAEEVPFNDEAARAGYPALGAAFLTCRNFQFGAQMARDGFIPFVP